MRSKTQLVAENALLRQQLIILKRQAKRPKLTKSDRVILVVLASKVKAWREALLLVKPATLLGWHRQGFRLFWRFKSHVKSYTSRIAPDTVALIHQMALENRLWGALRIRGELRKLGIHLSKRTVQKYMRQVRGRHQPGPGSQQWLTFLHNHAAGIWACDFLPVYTLFFSAVHVYFIIELHSRRIVQFGVTAAPTDAWVAQQLRAATPFGEHPQRLIRDNDSKFGTAFARVANASAIEVLKTPYRAPKANAICERLLGSVRRECLNHFFTFNERQLYQIVQAYVAYYNHSRPHRSLDQRTPEQFKAGAPPPAPNGTIVSFPILHGLHHAYRRVA